MDVAPVRVAPPREGVVAENYDAFDSNHGAPSREQEIQELLVGHRARLHCRDVQPMPRAPRLLRNAEDLLGEDSRGVLVLGVVELDPGALLPYEACPCFHPRIIGHVADPSVEFRPSDQPQLRVAGRPLVGSGDSIKCTVAVAVPVEPTDKLASISVSERDRHVLGGKLEHVDHV